MRNGNEVMVYSPSRNAYYTSLYIETIQRFPFICKQASQAQSIGWNSKSKQAKPFCIPGSNYRPSDRKIDALPTTWLVIPLPRYLVTTLLLVLESASAICLNIVHYLNIGIHSVHLTRSCKGNG